MSKELVAGGGLLPGALLVIESSRRDDVYPPHVMDLLGGFLRWVHPPMTADELLARPTILNEVEYLFTGWGAPQLTDDLLQHAPTLKLVLVAAGSIRYMTSEAFWRRSIPIVNAAAANAIPVAEFTVAQIILALKNTHRISREMSLPFAATTLSRESIPGAYRRNIGILSFGYIGRLVAERLKSFDLNVCVYDPMLRQETVTAEHITLMSIEEVFATCDVVTCHVPLLETTRGLVDESLIRSLRTGATFINTARGAVVEEAALERVLSDRNDLTALLDVTVEEPLPLDSPLRRLPNVFLSAHSAGSQGQECWRLGEHVADEFIRHRAGQRLLHQVTEEQAQISA